MSGIVLRQGPSGPVLQGERDRQPLIWDSSLQLWVPGTPILDGFEEGQVPTWSVAQQEWVPGEPTPPPPVTTPPLVGLRNLGDAFALNLGDATEAIELRPDQYIIGMVAGHLNDIETPPDFTVIFEGYTLPLFLIGQVIDVPSSCGIFLFGRLNTIPFGCSRCRYVNTATAVGGPVYQSLFQADTTQVVVAPVTGNTDTLTWGAPADPRNLLFGAALATGSTAGALAPLPSNDFAQPNNQDRASGPGEAKVQCVAAVADGALDTTVGWNGVDNTLRLTIALELKAVGT